MPETYVVKENEWLDLIARNTGRSPEAIVEANPELRKVIGENHEVLPPGWELVLPDRQVKSALANAGQRAQFVLVPSRKYLRVTLQDESGQPWLGWNYRLEFDGKTVDTTENPDGTVTTTPPIPRKFARAVLVLERAVLNPSLVDPSYATVALHIGGLDPLAGGPWRVRGVQKILTNLNHYKVPIDGKLNDETKAALRAFQTAEGIPPSGEADDATCKRLIRAQRNLLLPPQELDSAATPEQPASRDHSLPVSREAETKRAGVEKGNEYLEPTSLDQVTPRTIRNYDLFPREAYVAPCNRGEEAKNANVIRVSTNRFIFLDTGAWLGDQRHFGLLWGRHAYLCQYLPTAAHHDLNPHRPGLDADFLNGMRGRVRMVSRASASWAPSGDFDWDTLYLIVPDLHLMTGPIASVWKPNDPSGIYDFQPEIDLLRFVHEVLGIERLRGKIKAIQIGDSHDLWVGYGIVWKPEPHHLAVRSYGELTGSVEEDVRPLFEANKTRTVELIGPGSETIRGWVREIQGLKPLEARQTARWQALGLGKGSKNWVADLVYWQLRERRLLEAEATDLAEQLWVTADHEYGSAEVWLNPAEYALRLLEKHCRLEYIYGNHDNYLIIPEVCDAAGIARRRRYFDGARGVFIEHAHRMEATFTQLVPHNHDGDTSGYDETMKLYQQREQGGGGGLKDWVATQWASIHDQPGYWEQYARVWMGRHSRMDEERLAPPHIFVIGHTHIPNLFQISLKEGFVGR